MFKKKKKKWGAESKEELTVSLQQHKTKYSFHRICFYSEMMYTLGITAKSMKFIFVILNGLVFFIIKMHYFVLERKYSKQLQLFLAFKYWIFKLKLTFSLPVTQLMYRTLMLKKDTNLPHFWVCIQMSTMDK